MCERWRFSDVTLSSIAAVFISHDIWERAAIWFSADRDIVVGGSNYRLNCDQLIPAIFSSVLFLVVNRYLDINL